MVHSDTIIFHYGEIALKTGNRLFFEETFAQNLKRLLAPCGVANIRLVRGKVMADLLPDADIEAIKNRSKFLFSQLSPDFSAQYSHCSLKM